MANDSLQHYGVLGMKWGIRRYQPYTDGKKGIFLGKKKKQYAAAAERNRKYQEKKRELIGKKVKVGKSRGSAEKPGVLSDKVLNDKEVKSAIKKMEELNTTYKNNKWQMTPREYDKQYKELYNKVMSRKDAIEGTTDSEPKTSGKQKTTQKESVKKMTDVELRQKINRLQMEKQYKQLTAKEKSKGVKIAGSVLSKIGNKVADRVIDRTIVEPIDDFIKGKMR